MRECIFVVVFTLICSAVAFAQDARYQLWGELLADHVANSRVDYQGFKAEEQKLDEYLNILKETDVTTLSGDERLAFYINAYNAYTVKLILTHFEDGKPVESIKDIGGFFSSPWSIRFAVVGGEKLTLDNIEHDIIRVEFDEPRIHFAVNCASKSCPPLIAEPYTGARLDRQLEENTIKFINDKDFNYISGNTLHVSKIFKWYSEDFDDDVVGFVSRYARGELRSGLEAAGSSLKVSFLEYDWSLNGQ